MNSSEKLSDLLNQLEAALMMEALWEKQPPSASAFESQLPFFYDTMCFTQWLQWVFHARLSEISEEPGAWPSECGVAPMAEEYFKEFPDSDGEIVIEVLRQIDALVTNYN